MRRALAIHDLALRAANQWPDAIAVEDRVGSYTFAELLTESQRWSSWLRAFGARGGDRVVLTLSNRCEYVVAIVGTSMAGCTIVPCSARTTPYQLDAIRRDADPVVVVTQSDAATKGQIDDQHVLDLRRTQQGALAPDRSTPAATENEAPALLVYTSGSTGVPRGVVCPHERVLFVLGRINERLQYSAADVVFCGLPLSFDYALYQVLLGLASGARVVFGDPLELGPSLLRELRVRAITVLPAVPSLAATVVALARRTRDPLPTLRMVTNTGASLHADLEHALLSAFPAARVVRMYGLTECKRVAIADPTAEVPAGSVGTALRGTHVAVLNSDQRPCAPGEIGEIVVRGPHVMDGYWHDPNETNRVFRTDPTAGGRVLHTGDLGWLDERGNLFIEGRRDDVFKLNDVRVSIAELVSAAEERYGVEQAVVVRHRDTAVLIVASRDVTGAEVLAHVAALLGRQRTPSRCEVVDALPHTHHGKVDVEAIAAMLEARQ